MSDIFQEVEEDIRRERMKRLWDRFGIYIIATAVLIVLITAGYRGWEAWTTSRERAAGDALAALLQDAEDALPATAAERLTAYAEDAPAGAAMLARFRAASAYMAADRPELAVEVLGTLADDAPSQLYRDLAMVRLASALIETGDTAAAADAAAGIAGDGSNPFHRSAQEMMGLAAYAEGDMTEARRWFTEIEEGAGVSGPLRQRASLMLDLIGQSVPAAEAPAAEGETN
jgi:hypothetical protein